MGGHVQNFKYDKTSVESILEHARLLTGKTLDSLVELPDDIVNSRNRGDLGKLIEIYFFEHQPPNTTKPDFPDAGPFGLELKTTGVKEVKGEFRAKERLVMTMIDYINIINEDWEDSVFIKKCRLLLILFYLYAKEVPVHKRKFVLDPLLYDLVEQDEEIIKRDWEYIRDKIDAGKAHELSEGDTLYLGACRKGSGGEKEKLRSQPNSETKARARAFSFKPEFLNAIINQHTKNEKGTLKLVKGKTFEEVTIDRFRPYIGKSMLEIANSFGIPEVNQRDKSFEAKMARKIISGGKSSVLELDKAGIIVKTVRLKNGRLRESVSFPNFKYLEIVKENWEDSAFCEAIERRFLFVVIDISKDGNRILKKVGYWNMPYEDRLEAEGVWKETKRRVSIDARFLPKESESHVAHVRPHARNKKDTYPTPQGTNEVKKCFWLNRGYIESVINSL
jgi:DNA mismatch repair endonuclease MutH